MSDRRIDARLPSSSPSSPPLPSLPPSPPSTPAFRWGLVSRWLSAPPPLSLPLTNLCLLQIVANCPGSPRDIPRVPSLSLSHSTRPPSSPPPFLSFPVQASTRLSLHQTHFLPPSPPPSDRLSRIFPDMGKHETRRPPLPSVRPFVLCPGGGGTMFSTHPLPQFQAPSEKGLVRLTFAPTLLARSPIRRNYSCIRGFPSSFVASCKKGH